jgi:Putative addiction module component
MKPDEQSIEDQAAQLPQRDRARLALRLIESLEPGQDENVEEFWLDEAERRLKKYDEGATQADDADEAISDIERNLR